MAKKKNKKGFTLVELLVTIAIITLISGIAITIYMKTVNNSKEKAEIIAINNLKKAAELYSNEGVDDIKWITGYKNLEPSYEYTCISVQQLINAGYFNEKNINNEYYNKHNITNNTYLEVSRNLNYSKLSVDIKNNTIDYSKCMSSAINKQLESIKVEDLKVYTDKIIFRPTYNQHIDNAKFYIKYNNNGEKEKECINNICNLDSLIKNTTYPITLCIKNDNDYEYCEKLSTTTKDLEKPIISISNKNIWTKNKIITVDYNKENIYPNEEEYYYYSLAKATVKNGNFYKCQDYRKECSKTITNTIDANNWYKVVGNNPKLQVGEEGYNISSNKIIKALISDKTGNNSNEEDNINRIDNIPPTKPIITNPNNSNNNIKWVNYNFTLTINSEDEDSGIAYYQYTYFDKATKTGTNDTNSWITYNNSNKNTYITPEFSKERNQNVYIRVCDNVGNCSEKNSTMIKIDKTKPTVDNVSYSGLGVNTVTININGAKDTGGSGIEKYYFWIKNGDKIDERNNNISSFIFKDLQSKYYYIHGYVRDKAGNQSDDKYSSKFCIAGSYTVPKKSYSVGTQISYACENWRVTKNNTNDVLLVLDRAITKNEIEIAGIDVNNKSFVGTCNDSICRLRHCAWQKNDPGSNYCWLEGKPDSIDPNNGNPKAITNRQTDGYIGTKRREYSWDKSMVKLVLEKYVSNNITLKNAGDNLLSMSFSDGKGNRTGKIRIATLDEAEEANKWNLSLNTPAWTLTYKRVDPILINYFSPITNIGNTAQLIYPIINVKKG